MDPLAQLKDIKLPDPISPWPPAIGWWILAMLALCVLVALAVMIIKYYRKTGYRRAALRQLKQLTKVYQEERDQKKYLLNINMLLKQVCVNYYDKTQVSRLTGESWLRFLDQSAGLQVFAQGPGRILAMQPYTPDQTLLSSADLECLEQCCSAWIKKHR